MSNDQEYSLNDILSGFPTPEEVLVKQSQLEVEETKRRDKRIADRVCVSMAIARECISKARDREFVTFRLEDKKYSTVNDEEKESITRITRHLLVLGFRSTYRVDLNHNVIFMWCIEEK